MKKCRRWGATLRVAKVEGLNSNALAIIEPLILTGARRGEIERLKWKEVDSTGKQLKLADPKTGQKRIPLNSGVIGVLASLEGSGSFVFPAKRGSGHYVSTARVWAILRKKGRDHDVRLHDLRHSFASVGVTSGTPLMIVGALLGHADHATTQRYAHLAAGPVAAAAEDISRQLKLALDPIDQTMSNDSTANR